MVMGCGRLAGRPTTGRKQGGEQHNGGKPTKYVSVMSNFKCNTASPVFGLVLYGR
jgi:hypothetical protein